MKHKACRLIEAAQADAERFDEQYHTHAFSNAVEGIGWAEGWADGREAPHGIAYADWNEIRVRGRNGREDPEPSERARTLMKRLGDALERAGVELEGSDQVSTCDGCGLLIQTAPDCHSWQPEFVVGDGYITCAKCVDPEQYLSDLEGTTGLNQLPSVDPSAHGYLRVNADAYESGFHPGQTDDPRKVARELRAKGVTRFVFSQDEQGQFFAKWSVYIHESEAALLNLAPEPAWIHHLRATTACAESVEWAKQFETYETAWNACTRVGWLCWLLENRGGEAPRVRELSERFPGWQHDDVQVKNAACDWIRANYPRPSLTHYCRNDQ